MAAPPSNQDLVVVGASAGGIEALSRLVATLPADLPAPIVIAQHLEPSRVSHLGEILGRRSTLPVRSVIDQEALVPGTVYVVPANRDVEITDHAISLRRDQPGRPKPSIDLLLASAAQVFGEHLIAVILTGTGSDGADGARRVKEAGGTVVVQNPDTAQFPELPRSLAPTIVDIVADLEAIGPILRDLFDRSPHASFANRRTPAPDPARTGPRPERDRLQPLPSADDPAPPAPPDGRHRPGLDRRVRRLPAAPPRRVRAPRRQLPDQGDRLLPRFGAVRASPASALARDRRGGSRAWQRAAHLVGRLRHRRGGVLARDPPRRRPWRRGSTSCRSASSRRTSIRKPWHTPGAASIRPPRWS